jgi:hypothetical protein
MGTPDALDRTDGDVDGGGHGAGGPVRRFVRRVSVRQGNDPIDDRLGERGDTWRAEGVRVRLSRICGVAGTGGMSCWRDWYRDRREQARLALACLGIEPPAAGGADTKSSNDFGAD